MGKKKSTEKVTNETVEQPSNEALTTTDKLFPEFRPGGDQPVEIPKQEVQQEVQQEVKEEPEIQKEEVSAPEKTEVPDIEYLNDLIDKNPDTKVKVKIYGEEKEVTAQELLRGYQTAQALTKKGQELSEIARQLEENKKTFESEKKKSSDLPEDGSYYDTPEEPLQREVQRLKEQIESFMPYIGDIQYERDVREWGRQMEMKGADDALDYRDKIESRISQLPLEQQREATSFTGYESIYYQIKLEEMKKTEKPKEVKAPDERPKPKIAPVEEPGSVVTSEDTDAVTKTRDFEKAKESGNWLDYLSKYHQPTIE